MAAVVVALVSGCGDPGFATSNVALAREEDGELVLLVRLCDRDITSVELGPGDDFWADATVVFRATDPVPNRLTLHLSGSNPGLTSSAPPAEVDDLSVPFFVRVVTPDG